MFQKPNSQTGRFGGCLDRSVYMHWGVLKKLGAEEKSAWQMGIAEEVPHGLGDFGKDMRMNLVTNKPELFCPGV